MAHIENHIKRTDLVSDSTLHVVGVCSNSARWHSRYRLARDFIENLSGTPNVELYVVECAHGDRHHEITISDNHRHLQVRTNTEIWNKENLINLGVKYLIPRQARYLSWCDMDILFRDKYWAQAALHEMQTGRDLIQPWEHCLDLDPHGSVLHTHTSFGAVHEAGVRKQKKHTEPYKYGHTGYAWTCTRKFWEAAGGLIEVAILGAGDAHVAWSAIGDGEHTVPKQLAPSYHRIVKEWQDRAVRVTHGQVGYIPGRIEHFYHGQKADRKYKERWKLLVDNNYDPDKNLMHDEQGLIKLINNHPLENAIRKYNRERLEDSY